MNRQINGEEPNDRIISLLIFVPEVDRYALYVSTMSSFRSLAGEPTYDFK